MHGPNPPPPQVTQFSASGPFLTEQIRPSAQVWRKEIRCLSFFLIWRFAPLEAERASYRAQHFLSVPDPVLGEAGHGPGQAKQQQQQDPFGKHGGKTATRRSPLLSSLLKTGFFPRLRFLLQKTRLAKSIFLPYPHSFPVAECDCRRKRIFSGFSPPEKRKKKRTGREMRST